MKSRMTLITFLTRQAHSWNDWFWKLLSRQMYALTLPIQLMKIASQTSPLCGRLIHCCVEVSHKKKRCTSVPGRTLGMPISIWASILDIKNCMF